MSEPVLKVFSYLPNPRVWKALIAADLLNLQIEVAGDKPSNLDKWLWVESVTEGRHRKRFVAHRGRRDSVRGAEGESHFRRLRNSNKSRAVALFFFG